MTGKEAWDEVGRNLEGLALKLKMHLEQGVGESDRESVQAALRNLPGVVEQGVSAVGRAVRDPAVRSDVEHVAGAFRDALTATVSGLGAALRPGAGPWGAGSDRPDSDAGSEPGSGHSELRGSLAAGGTETGDSPAADDSGSGSDEDPGQR